MNNSDLTSRFQLDMRPYTGARHIAVALSGGADSIALTHMLQVWCQAQDIKLTAMTVDHGLRAESADEAKNVHAQMSAMGIDHVILKLDQDLGPSRIQENARHARYDLMLDYCKQNSITHLLTAHHLDDQFETFLMRLSHGSGVKGLCAIRPERDIDDLKLVRPLLFAPKSDLIEYCTAHNLKWVQDPSNADPKYDRVLLRQHSDALSKLGLTSENIEKSRQKIALAQSFITQQIDRIENDIVHDNAGETRIDYEGFLSLHEYAQQKLLQRILQKYTDKPYPPKSGSLESLIKKIQGRTFKGATLHNCKISLSGNFLIIMPE